MNIFITGGTSGLGLALGHAYQKDSHRVALCGRDLSKLSEQERKDFYCYEADVTDRETLHLAMKSFEKEVGDLDLVIASAGRSVGKKTRDQNFELSREVININVIGLMNTFEGALQSMLSRGRGQLVAISSVAGFVGLPGAGAYSASKAAVTIYCESLTLDLKERGIDVSVLCPGFVDTPLTKKNNHSMPFLMPANEAAQLMKNAIDKRRPLYIFPWQMKIVIQILRYLPRTCYRFLMQLKLFNYSQK